MARITNSSLDKLRDAIDMVDLVGGQTDLRRAGSQYTGLCPFHDERSPSFSVNPVEKLYYCFGCQAGGDAIDFVRETENLDFSDAVEWLADRYGVELEYEQSDPAQQEQHRRRERLLELLDRTSRFYERYLWDSPEAEKAREYLAGRGFDRQTLEQFRVGFSPSAWDRVLVPALESGFTEQEMIDSGLAQRSQKSKGLYDRFRGRIMFPLADPRGRIRGFGARAMRDSEKPKYLNSSDGPVYSKGRQLFGANIARQPAARSGRVIVVEGYADVLALHQAGFAESVAIMGTAMTDDQVAELSRLAKTVYLALDADRAGRKAMLRGARIADGHGVELLVVRMPEGRDPADVVLATDGEAGFKRMVDDAVTVLEFEVENMMSEADLSNARGKDALLVQLEPVFGAAPESMVRQEMLRRVADRLDLPEPLLSRLRDAKPPPIGAEQRLGSAKQAVNEPDPFADDKAADVDPGPEPESHHANATNSQTSRAGVSANALRERTERQFMAACLANPREGKQKLTDTEDWMLSTQLMRELRVWLLENFENPLAGATELKPQLRDAVTEVSMISERETASAQVVELGFLQLEVTGLERAIANAPAAEKKKLSLRQQDVREKLHKLSAELA
jgi:DNA primase